MPDKLDEYYSSFDEVRNSYLTEEIEVAKDEMCSRLNELREYMAPRFFDYRGKPCLDPDRNIDRGATDITNEDIACYHQQARELTERLEAAKQALADYRRIIQQHLFI